MNDPITVVPYDAAWPTRFRVESQLLRIALNDLEPRIEHIGSTSVPGLAAKPIIDILVGVQDLPGSRACFGDLRRLGYLYAPYRADEMHWFCKPHPSRRTHHLHLVPTNSPRFREELAFRDHLRSHPRAASEYGALKRRLAVEFRHDREAYAAAKGAFIRNALPHGA